MKIAGRKNDGAWFRTNKWLKGSPLDFKTRLKADPDLIDVATTVYGICGNLAGTSQLGNVGVQGFPASAVDMLSMWVDNGFPRQVYNGTLSWDVYDKIEPGGSIPGTTRTNTSNRPIYVPKNQTDIRQAAFKLRNKLNRHRLVSRQMTDIANGVTSHHLNPGGVANATQD